MAFSLASQYAAFPVISPFISGFEVWARFEAGDATGALDLIRTVWGHMQKGSPYYSGGVWETLAPDATPKFGPGTSLAHPWSSGPTPGLSKYVLGVRPASPGYKTWLIEPQPGNLSWAEGTVPTPYGPIAVWWQNTAQGLLLAVWAPEGTRGSVGVPVSGEGALLTHNGRTVAGASAANEPGGRTGYGYVQDLGPGVHLVQVTEKLGSRACHRFRGNGGTTRSKSAGHPGERHGSLPEVFFAKGLSRRGNPQLWAPLVRPILQLDFQFRGCLGQIDIDALAARDDDPDFWNRALIEAPDDLLA